MSPPNSPNLNGGNSADPLLARYHEAVAFESAKPSDAVRANVFAHAQRIAAQSALQRDRRNSTAANDSRWRFAGLAAAFVTAGVAGWLTHQYFNVSGSDAERRVVSAPAAAAAAAPAPKSESSPSATTSAAASPSIASNEAVASKAASADAASVAAASEPVRPSVPAPQPKAKPAAPEPTVASARANPAAAQATDMSRANAASVAAETNTATSARETAAASSSINRDTEQSVAVLDTQKRALRRDAAPPPAAAAAAPMVMAAPPPPALARPPTAGRAATTEVSDAAADRNAVLTVSLLAAVQADDVTRVNQLLAQGANPNSSAQSIRGFNELQSSLPIVAAAERGNMEILDRLLRAGADVNAMDSRGRSALSVARTAGREALVRRLLEAGAR